MPLLQKYIFLTTEPLIMKRLKIGTAALVAVLAMSFTIASHAGAFKKTAPNAKFTYSCGSHPTDISDFSWCNRGTAVLVNGQTLKADVPPVGTCIFNLSSPSTGFTCNQIPTFFCCAEPDGTCTPSCSPPPGVILGKLHFSSIRH